MAGLEKQFGSLVRYHRKRLGLSQAQLAEKIDRQPNAIQRIERGETAPTFETLARLSTALEIDARDLLGAGPYAAQEGRDDPLVAIVELLSHMNSDELTAMQQVIETVVGFRRA